ncbi:MAG: hypothetical protein DRJ65_20130 [Acidobacteria bacterium]|nr:MAG: hypothetical protein DRJ65_20130 [Acidobacteriota bacterium]
MFHEVLLVLCHLTATVGNLVLDAIEGFSSVMTHPLVIGPKNRSFVASAGFSIAQLFTHTQNV